MPPVPGHGQFWDQISVKTYVGTPSFYCEMRQIKLGHAQFQKRDYTADLFLSYKEKGVVTPDANSLLSTMNKQNEPFMY